MATMTTQPRPLVVGDIVSLRSGGPELTVLGHLPGGEVQVGWFAKGRRFEIEELPISSVILVRPIDDAGGSDQ
jgi:uncharacterized protein YodC (DUF2158 family)